MNKDEALVYLENEIEEIEREQLALNLSTEQSRRKKEAVDQILKVVKEVQIDDEDKKD